jgi:hypothetical protein
MSLFHRFGILGATLLVLCGSSYDELRRLQKQKMPLETRGKHVTQAIVNIPIYQVTQSRSSGKETCDTYGLFLQMHPYTQRSLPE